VEVTPKNALPLLLVDSLSCGGDEGNKAEAVPGWGQHDAVVAATFILVTGAKDSHAIAVVEVANEI
jgi:hypothetical protein